MTDEVATRSPRGARCGFFWQDLFATRELVRCALEPEAGIDSVNVEAYNAGHADDVVVCRQGHWTYFQLKHSVDSERRFVASDLFGGSMGETVFEKLFSTHKDLEKRHASYEIQLHTNRRASDGGSNRPISPFELEEKLLTPMRADPAWLPPDEMGAVVDELVTRAGAASRDELVAFLRHLRLVFEAPDVDALEGEAASIISKRFYLTRDKALNVAGALLAKVYAIATDSTHGRTPLSRLEIEQLIKQCAATESRRVEHYLELPEHHLPRSAFGQEVLEQIEAMPSGYLLVTGAPGCGKTTFATWFADTHPEKVLLRYHAFHPSALTDSQRRWRISNLGLVEELLGALADRFPTSIPKTYPNAERIHVAEETLLGELEKLGAKQKWVLIVDGLDHVVRSEIPQADSLFAVLPRRLPPNIVVLLLGQPGWTYPSWLTTAAVSCSFPPLSEDDSREILLARLGWQSSPQIEAFAHRLHVRSQGNPLSIHYSIEAVAGTTLEEASSRLDALRIGPDLHAFYRELGEGLRTQMGRSITSPSLITELYRFFALATVRITPARLARAYPDELSLWTARDILDAMRPILVETGDRRFRLFHDDFRRFVEQDLDEVARRETHSRHVLALRDAAGDELEDLAEHLWLAGEDDTLSELPYSRPLTEWLEACSLGAVIAVHRLALAAALRLADTSRVVRASLALRRVSELDDDDEDERFSFKQWLCRTPPAEAGHRATEVRQHAIEAACRQFPQDPVGAKTLVRRILRATPKEGRDDIFYDLVKWWLISGGLAPLMRFAGALGSEDHVTRIVAAYATDTMDLDRLTEAATRLALEGRSWGEAFSRTALDALIASDTKRGHALVEALVPLHTSLDDATARMAAFLSHLHGVPVARSEALLRPTVDHHYPPEVSPDLSRFTLGWSLGRFGPSTEFDNIRLPAEIDSRGHWSTRLSEGLFRVGAFIGLFHRHPNLVAPRHLNALWRETEAPPGGHDRDTMWRREARAQMAILVAIACGRDDRLRPTLLERVMPEIERARARPELEDYNYFDALWFLDEARWRMLAEEVTGSSVPPFSNEYSREGWYERWTSRAPARGVTVPESFRKLSRIAKLGIPRKTNPADLAIAAFKGLPWNDELAAVVSEFCDLQIRAAHYSEATRYTASNLAKVLALALRHAPALLEAEYKHSVSSLSLDVSGVLPSLVADELLASGVDDIATRDLEALWWWVCSCPDSFDGNARGRGPAVATAMAAVHAARSESQLAEKVHRWGAICIPASRAADDDSHGEETPEPVSPPRLEDIQPLWFSAWVRPDEFRVLAPMLRTHHGEALSRLAHGVAQSRWPLYDLYWLPEGLTELAPDVDWATVLRLSLDDIRERVELQPEPTRATSATHDDRVSTMLALMLDGLDSRDTLTIERTLRSAAEAARSPRLTEALQRELVHRIQDPDDRRVEYALALMPHLHGRRPWFDEALAGLRTHPHAGVRAQAVSLLGLAPSWDSPNDTMPALAMPTLAAYGTPEPDAHAPGIASYERAAPVLRKHASSFARILGGREETHLEAMTAILTTLPTPPVSSHAPSSQAGRFQLSSHRAHDAAARYLTRIARRFDADTLHEALSFLAPFDAWLVTTPPTPALSSDDVTLCAVEQRWSANALEVGLQDGRWRVLALVPTGAELSPAHVFNDIFRSGTAPAFVTQMGPGAGDTGVHHADVLAFRPQNLTSIPSGVMELVPRWDHPLFDGLAYRGGASPGWYTDDGHVVVTPYRLETRGDEGGRATRNLSSGWTIDRGYLERFLELHPDLRMVELSRHESKGGVTHSSAQVGVPSHPAPVEDGP